MARVLARSRFPLLRLLVLTVLALRLLLQPVLATTGEMHGLAHDPSGMHAHDASLAPADKAPAEPREADEGGAGLLHLLLHFAHCCGATTVMPAALEQIPALPMTRLLPVASTPLPPQARLLLPFKPPRFA